MPSVFSFPLVGTALGPDGPVTRPYATAPNLRSPLGHGLLSPLRRDGRGDFAADGGVALVKASIAQLLGIQCDSDYTQGELPWRTELGSLLHLLKMRNNDALLSQLGRVYVAQAIERWEPRVRIKRVTITRQDARTVADRQTVLVIRLVYDIVLTSGSGISAPDVGQTLEV